MKKTFMPRSDSDRALWLQNFAAKLPLYAARYNLSLAHIEDIKASSEFFSFCMDHRNQYEQYLRKLTQHKKDLADADVNLSAELPVPPTFTDIPSFVPSGIFKRASAMALSIKNSLQYTVADGNDLGLEGVDVVHEIHTAKPQIATRLISGGHPEIVWKKQGMDGIEIFKEDENGRWQLLAIDTYPNYTDTTPLPAAGQHRTNKYKAIYRLDDQQVGLWSDVVSITVTGAV